MAKKHIDLSEYHSPQTVPDQYKPGLLVGGDFSGIQKYIFQIASTYANKNLKGRSFYLQLLSDAIVHKLLIDLELTEEAIVYNAGGCFYLVAPNEECIITQLEQSAEEIECALFKAHGTVLYLALDYVPLTQDAISGINGQSVQKTWNELFSKRSVQKNRKFSRLIETNPKLFFSPRLNGGSFARDSITGEELPNETIPDKSGLVLSNITKSQIDLGAALRTATVMAACHHEIPEWNSLTHIEPAGLGQHYYLMDMAKLQKSTFILEREGLALRTKELPSGDYQIHTFEELTNNDSFSRLGILRMDVDNLGHIFQEGIPAEFATMTRMKDLSQKFTAFFTENLHEIRKEKYLDNTLVVYSGGDDIFIVGNWDATIAIAEDIRKKFGDYTLNSPAFSISGGITMVKDKYPLMKAAQDCEKEEKAAKRHQVHTSNGQILSKNSICILGMPLNWHTEFEQVRQLKNDLCLLLKNGKINKSFLTKVMIHAANAEIQSHKVTKIKTYWMLSYDLSRVKKDCNGNEAKTLIENCIKEIYTPNNQLNGQSIETDYHPLELWNLACRWAELDYRTNK